MFRKCYPFIFIFQLMLAGSVWGQVDLPTGKANFSVPIFNYNDGGRLSFNISLNYSGGGGIFVNQIPTSVGLGWDLMAGGVIVRRTIGEPDDQVQGTYDGVKCGEGYIVPNPNIFNPIGRKAGYVPLVPSGWTDFEYQPDFDVLKDLQQDIFEFTFAGRTGRFMISDDQRIFPMDNSKLKIEKREVNVPSDGNVITTISKFIITDENGIRYTFSACERSNLIKYKKGRILTTSVGNTVTIPFFDVTSAAVRTAWYLTEISDPLSGHKITLNYADYPLQYLIGYEAVYTSTSVNGQTKVGAQSMPQWFSGTRKRITGITLPDGKTKISFNYFDTDLADLPGEKALKQIIVKSDSNIVSGYQFAYEYFLKDSTRAFDYSFSAEELKYARLCLKSVQKTGKFNIPDAPYTFSYYTKLGTDYIPGRARGQRDHWGYSNGNLFEQNYDSAESAWTSTKVLTTELQRNVGYGAPFMGVLKSVNYPTGGKLLYEYEKNDAWFAGASKLSGGIRVKQTTAYDFVDSTRKIIKQYKYVAGDGTSSGWGYETPVYSDVNYSYLIIPPLQGGYKAGNLIFSMAFNTSTLPVMYSAWSVGAVEGIGAMVLQNLFFMVVVTIVIDILTPPPTTQYLSATNTQFYSHHAAMNNELPHLYKRVVVYEGDVTNNIGWTAYEYTSPDEFPISVPTRAQPYALKSRCLPWVYGLPKKVQEYSKANKLLSEVTYTYNPQTLVPGNGNIAWNPKKVLMCPDALFQANTSNIELYSETYQPLYGRTDLASITSKQFDSTGSFRQVLTTNTYNLSNNLPWKSQTINNAGDTLESRTYFPQDYNGNNYPVLKVLKDINVLSEPVATEIWRLGVSGQKMLGSTVYESKFQTSGDVKPEAVYEFEYNDPVTTAVAGTFTGNVLNRLPTVIKKQQSNNFDNTSNLIHTSNTNGPEIGYQWGYGDGTGAWKKKITAVVRNAHAAHQEKTAASGTVTNSQVAFTGSSPVSVTITLAQQGTIYLHMEATPPSIQSNSLCDYTLTGPGVSSTGKLCYIKGLGRLVDSYNTYADLYSNYKVFTNLSAGTYTLTASQVDISNLWYSYYTDPVISVPSEFVYQGFEDALYTGSIIPYAGDGCKEGDYTTTFTIPNSRSYRVDYRYYNAGKWIFNAKPYTNGMVLSDGDAIDEVRIYPSDAVINTYTYDPMFGVTSETDINGNTVFKEYDHLGRISMIRDQDKNIIQRICYNYAGQPEDCGGRSYGNVLMSQTFTAICGPGYTPGQYTYTIPAGTYTADDQTAANALALDDMTKNGQKNANQLGGCICVGPQRKEINGQCVAGEREDFVQEVEGGARCRAAYWYRYPDGTHSAAVLGAYVNCP